MRVPQPLRGVVSGQFFRPENQATDRRKTARLVRQDWPVGQQHIWTHFAPSALISPAGGVTASHGALCARLSR